LTYALLGRTVRDLTTQAVPEPSRLADILADRFGGRRELAAEVQRARREAVIWPVPVPPDVMTGISAAQFAAALRQLIDLVTPDRGMVPRVRVDRPLDPTERALQSDVPPHHGV
jgi:hypothetical protein